MATAMSANCLISPEPLLEQFNCPICLNIMKDVWVTTCFHRFCENCIKESINAAHRCPLCNKILQQDDAQRDAQYNSLLEAIDKAIQDAESQKAKSFATDVVNKIGDNSIRATLEELFRDTLVSSLANHLTSENDMRIRYKRKKNEIEQAFNQTITELQAQKLSQDQYKRELEKRTNEFHQKIKALDEEIRNVQILFLQAYKSHLTEHISNFGAVSTQIHVTLWKEDRLYKTKDKQYPVKLMRPEDRMDSLLPLLNEIVEANNDKIAKYGDMILYTCIDTFENEGEQDIIRRLEQMNTGDDDDIDDNNGLLTVSSQCRPILEHKLTRGTLVVVHGDVVLESEVPKKCFIQVYNENPNIEHRVDYFQCPKCVRSGQPLKWICKSCAMVCHKDHKVSALMFGNRAQGPKCDCRKKECHIYPKH